jgi:hypothetical protein
MTRREIERERDKLSSLYLNISESERRWKEIKTENETDIWIDSKMGKYCIEKNDKRKQI